MVAQRGAKVVQALLGVLIYRQELQSQSSLRIFPDYLRLNPDQQLLPVKIQLAPFAGARAFGMLQGTAERADVLDHRLLAGTSSGQVQPAWHPQRVSRSFAALAHRYFKSSGMSLSLPSIS
jgi:hypothetical protein